MTIQLLTGDVRDVLPSLADASVHCVVTSPPYYALRSYLDASHPDKHRELGSEPTPDAYIAAMVAVFREVKRVLRPDGTCWVNMGSSYSTGKGSNVTDQLNRLIEGGSVFFTDTRSVAVSGHSVSVTTEHEGAPDGVFPGLLASERCGIKERHEDFCKVADLFTYPTRAGGSPGSGGVLMDAACIEVSAGECQHVPVIGSDLYAEAEPILAVLRPACTGAGEHDEATFAIDKPNEPGVGGGVRWHSTWDTFAANAICKGVEDIDSVDQSVALGNRLHKMAGLLRDFRVAKATDKKLTLTSIHGGLTLAISNVWQLWFVLRCGSIVPYSRLYADASRSANALQPKQDLGMPWRFARALQEDGWILRSPIIWAKPNPMPESCRDRCTSAHEHVFMLTKKPRYYFDADAIAEPAMNTGGGEGATPDKAARAGITSNGTGLSSLRDKGAATRACRNVWTIPTHAYPAAHFATYPPELAERCIKAGTSEKGCCAACGAPWVRVTEETAEYAAVKARLRETLGPDFHMKRAGTDAVKGAGTGTNPATLPPKNTTTGWSPSCTHDADVVPCTVLDCFSGAGTTLLVADRLQRHAIGIDLNASYADLARRRIEADAPLFTSWAPAEDPADQRMADLFAEAAE